MLEVACLPTDSDGGVQVKGQLVCLARGLALDKAIQTRDVLQLRVRVEKERRVVSVRTALSVQFLEVCDQVMYPLGVQEL